MLALPTVTNCTENEGTPDINTVQQAVRGHDITLVPVAVAPGHPVGQPLKLKSPFGWEMQLPSNVNTRWLIDVLRQLP